MASTTALISLKAAFVARPSTFTSYGISLRRDGFDQRLDRIDSFLDLTDLSTDLFIDHMDLFHRHHDSFLDLTELVVDIDLEVITNLLHCDLEGFETRLGDLAITAAIPANCVRAASLREQEREDGELCREQARLEPDVLSTPRRASSDWACSGGRSRVDDGEIACLWMSRGKGSPCSIQATRVVVARGQCCGRVRCVVYFACVACVAKARGVLACD